MIEELVSGKDILGVEARVDLFFYISSSAVKDHIIRSL